MFKIFRLRQKKVCVCGCADFDANVGDELLERFHSTLNTYFGIISSLVGSLMAFQKQTWISSYITPSIDSREPRGTQNISLSVAMANWLVYPHVPMYICDMAGLRNFLSNFWILWSRDRIIHHHRRSSSRLIKKYRPTNPCPWSKCSDRMLPNQNRPEYEH